MRLPFHGEPLIALKEYFASLLFPEEDTAYYLPCQPDDCSLRRLMVPWIQGRPSYFPLLRCRGQQP